MSDTHPVNQRQKELSDNDEILIEVQPRMRRKVKKYHYDRFEESDFDGEIPLYTIKKLGSKHWTLYAHSTARLHQQYTEEKGVESWRTDYYVWMDEGFALDNFDTKKAAMEAIRAEEAEMVEAGHYRVYPGEENSDLRGINEPFVHSRHTFINVRRSKDPVDVGRP